MKEYLKKMIYIIYNIKSNLKTITDYIKYSFQPSATILFYHRVANISDDPHKLSVSPSNFYKQMDYLSKNFRVVRLDA